MSTREELDTEIVVAISVFKAAKREELVKAAYDTACGALAAYDVWEGTKTDAARANYGAAKTASKILYAAAYQQVTREELVNALEEARHTRNVNTHSAADAAWYALDTAWNALKAYDKENT